MNMYIERDCLKIKNESGIVMSIGGDDNCRGDGRKNRMSVVFHDDKGRWEAVHAPIFEDEYENGEISVWSEPVKLLECLAAHLGYRITQK